MGQFNNYSSPMQLINDISLQIKKLSVFKDIKENCKVGKYSSNKEYYIVQPGMLQRFWRIYYNENRENTWEYLDKDFSEFATLLDRISVKLNMNFNNYEKHALKIISFIDDIVPGLYNLKKTYSDTNKIIAKIDSIILTLIDFKDNFTKLRKTFLQKKKKIYQKYE